MSAPTQLALFAIEKTAQHLRSSGPNEVGALWRHYRLSPPVVAETFDEALGDHAPTSHQYVIVSAATVGGCPETYIFPADDMGEVVSWGELSGSFRGALDHERALRNMGYRVVS